MRNLLRSLGLVVIVTLAMLAFAPKLINQDQIRSTLVDELTTALGKPVDIESINLKFLPSPSIEIHHFNAALGDTLQESFAVDLARADLSLLQLVQGQIAITQLTIANSTLNQQLIDKVKSMFAGLDARSGTAILPVTINKLRLENIYWQTTERSLGPLQISAYWKDAPKPILIEAVDSAHQLMLSIKPDGTDWVFEMVSVTGGFPFSLPVTLDRFSIKGRYQPKHIEFEDIQAEGLTNTLQATGSLDWSDQWQLNLNTHSSGFKLELVLTSLGYSAVPGAVSGKCEISMQAGNPRELLSQSRYLCDLDYLYKGQAAPLRLGVDRTGNTTQIDATTTSFTLPLGPKMYFSTLKLKGELAGKRLDISTGIAQAYAGEARFNGSLDWSSGWQLNFTSQSQELQLEPLLKTFDKRKISGALSSQCKGRLQGPSFAALLNQTNLDCGFTINNGLVYEADLEQAAQLIKTKDERPASEKQTPFDHLSGQLNIANSHYKINKLKITSSALAASGDIEINPKQELSGQLSVGLKKTGKILSVPLVVAGTTEEPSLRPTKSSMTGAGAGTLLLGPGIGTAIGAKIGEAVGNITGFFRNKNTSD